MSFFLQIVPVAYEADTLLVNIYDDDMTLSDILVEDQLAAKRDEQPPINLPTTHELDQTAASKTPELVDVKEDGEKQKRVESARVEPPEPLPEPFTCYVTCINNIDDFYIISKENYEKATEVLEEIQDLEERITQDQVYFINTLILMNINNKYFLYWN